MTIEPLEPSRRTVSGSSKKTKSIIIFGGIASTIIVGLSVFVTVSTGVTSAPTKHAICTAKVLELAQRGIIRGYSGYYGSIYISTLCDHLTGKTGI
jgi:hypothetical protein